MDRRVPLRRAAAAASDDATVSAVDLRRYAGTRHEDRRYLWLPTRSPRIDLPQREALVGRARTPGYDTARRIVGPPQ